MTGKERLKEIIAVVKSQTEAVRKLSHNDLNWLIEQSERVQELEIWRNEVIQNVVERNSEYEKCREQNKRYREALEEIKDEAEWMIKLNDNGKKFESILYRCEEALEEI